MLSEHEVDFLEKLFERAKETDPQNGRDCFNSWMKGFCEDNAERFEQYGEDTRFSSRQWEFLNKAAMYLGVER